MTKSESQSSMDNMRDRICRQCGATFKGGPRAWYCPACRIERHRETLRGFKANRPLGSTDICLICGNEYIVKAGRQKYCPDCAAEQLREADRKQGLEYYRKNKETINPARNKRRRKHPEE